MIDCEKALKVFHQLQDKAFNIYSYSQLNMTVPYTIGRQDPVKKDTFSYYAEAGDVNIQFESSEELKVGTIVYILNHKETRAGYWDKCYLAVTEEIFRKEIEQLLKELGILASLFE